MLKEIFQVYLNRLIDLSAKNKAIYLPKLIGNQMVDLKSFHFLRSKDAFSYVEALIAGKKSIPLIKVLHMRDRTSNKLSRHLNRLQQSVKLAEEETGEKNLYVGWPFVEGKLINEQPIKCPLLFFPVDLVQKDGEWCLERREEESLMLNHNFLLAYSHATQAKVNRDLSESLEDLPKDATEFLTALYNFLKENLNLNFNQEMFEKSLQDFPESSRSEDQEKYKTGLLKLHSYAVLGQFSQKGSHLVRDFEELMEMEGPESLEELFAERFAVDPDHLTEVREDNMLNVFPLDASQEEVFKAVRAGESCVVEGPPGTGKSQLISNLVADYIARGKKVLVVSQKRAALDVVYDRLKPLGFGNFLGLVHDFRADRKDLYKKVSDQIEALDHYKELNRGLDAIQLERNFIKSARQVSTNLEYLEDFKAALYNTEECGIPIKQLYVTGNAAEKGFDLTQYYKDYPWDRLDDFFRDLKIFLKFYPKYLERDSFWLHRLDFSKFGQGALPRLRETVNEILDLKATAEATLSELMGQSFSHLFIYECYAQKPQLIKLQKLIINEHNYQLFLNLLPFPAGEFDLLWFKGKISTFQKLLKEEIEWTLPDEEIEKSLGKAIQILEAKSSWMGKAALMFDRKAYGQVKEFLQANKLPDSKDGLKKLVRRLENRLNLNHQYALFDEKGWIEMPPKPFGETEFNERVGGLVPIIEARLVVEEVGKLGPFLSNSKFDFEFFHLTLEELLGITHLIEHKLNQWERYLSTVQIRHLLTTIKNEGIENFKKNLDEEYTELVMLDKLRRKVRKVDLEIMNKLAQQYSELSFDEIKWRFLSGLRESWIDHIETKYPVLREITSAKFEHIIQELTTSVKEKQEMARFNAELKLREQTFQELEFNRLGNMVTYRDLTHQVRKKKKVWPMKKLLGNFKDEIFRLIPCWLASPETVSALFPMQQDFDLVVFDESSQCYSEKGLPAMLRGKQVVIAGDSQQLQPYDLYRVRLDVEEEGVEVETDSLLDLTSNYFSKYYLNSHYRSQSLSLIQYSNQHFYEDRLEMLPDRLLLNDEFQAFDHVHVDGIWTKQTNPVEAEEVVEQVLKCQHAYPGESIGVITFNFFQMDLITDLLSKHSKVAKGDVKVKNIENVQGDEFDHVIFSIGYAKNKAGKFTANFGLLSKAGGENRLNVAITRARRRVTVVCSMLASDFKTKHLTHDGVKRLRGYLSYVEQVVQGRKMEITPRPVFGFQADWLLTELLAVELGEFEVKRLNLSLVYDLAIKKAAKFEGAVLTDDQRLYGAKSVKSAFVYHPEWLKAKNWPVHFVFSRQYWLQNKGLIVSLLEGNSKI
ncbi:AAA domain-containing protein [Litoribacter populi]|uniref:AAA domain-containing protein n=1 Tax=Litoribacter populi TaxID=2598460 RepID=UPI001180B6F2|nr:AAA domain-containing protein [Litoribacter populi]